MTDLVPRTEIEGTGESRKAQAGDALVAEDGTALTLKVPVRELSANASALFMDWIVGTGTWTLSLPAITTEELGRPIRVTNVGTGFITVDPDGADTIGDGVSTDMIVLPGDSVIILARSLTDWRLG